MSATLTKVKDFKFGNAFMTMVDVAFDDSYPAGGESVLLPLRNIMAVFAESDDDRYRLEYDRSAAKVRVFNNDKLPLLVVEEDVAVASNAGTLKHRPLYIVAVQATAGTTTGAFKVIPKGETTATKQVAVDFTTGGLTFKTTDAVTAAKITYIPLRGGGYLSTVIVDETVKASASKVNLASRACLVQYVWDDTDGVLCDLEPSGEAPSATHKAVVDINDSGKTSIDSHADDAANVLKVTYVPFDQIPADCFIDDTDVALSSGAYSFIADGKYRPLIVPGLGCVLTGEVDGGGNAEMVWEGPGGTAANGVATWNPIKNYILTNQDTAMATTAIPWIALDPLRFAGQEVQAATDLSALTARLIAFGY